MPSTAFPLCFSLVILRSTALGCLFGYSLMVAVNSTFLSRCTVKLSPLTVTWSRWMRSIGLPACSPEVICHTPSSFFSSVLAAASSPPGDRPTQRRDTPTKIASPQCVRIAYLHALTNGPDLGRLHRFSLDSAWGGSRRATPGRIGD